MPHYVDTGSPTGISEEAIFMNDEVWIVGSGQMGVDYARVLEGQELNYLVIGRGETSARSFEDKTGAKVIRGGLEGFLKTQPTLPRAAIVCVCVEQLSLVACKLLDYGVSKILVEKPGGIYLQELEMLSRKATDNGAEVFIAYNRRFYASVAKAIEIIRDDGGVTSFNFEFTEWSHVIEGLEKGVGVKERWFLGNSTHVVDLAFYLGGKPKEISCFTSGGLAWHPTASVFAGAGISDKGALFSYQANWGAPGRWSVEVLTKRSRLIFRPMEKLQIQKVGSVAIEEVTIDGSLDLEYKPGLYKQVKSFVTGENAGLCDLTYHEGLFKTYEKMAGYSGRV